MSSKKTVNRNRKGIASRMRKPQSAQFVKYMSQGWAKKEPAKIDGVVPKQFAERRRLDLSLKFPGDRLIINAGSEKTRSNDTEYAFRPNSAFSYFTGLGLDYEPDAVLLFEPVEIKIPTTKSGVLSTLKKKQSRLTHLVTLFIEPPKGRDQDEFFTSSSHGEFWVGPRPNLEQFEISTGIKTRPLSELKAILDKKPNASFFKKTRIHHMDGDKNNDELLSEVISEMRLVKDIFEIAEIRKAVEITAAGFKEVVREIPKIKNNPKSERDVEAVFNRTAIVNGNTVGYPTIAASGENSTILHWMRNNGTLKDQELLLLDAGVEVESLYTADVTRTIPISGEFTYYQKQIYDAVLEAANAGMREAKPGNMFKDIHNAAVDVLTKKLIELGIIKVSFEEAKEKDLARRWMCHGTSHHLGLDVHDCSAARSEEYLGVLKEGMVLTVEPGLYFHSDDELVNKEYRGIGIRIEDDILITSDGYENLSSILPRNREHLESWIKLVQSEK